MQALPGHARGLQGLPRLVGEPIRDLTPWEVSYTRLCFRAAALAEVSEVVEQLQGGLVKVENFQKLLELKKDLIGVDNLLVPGRVG